MKRPFDRALLEGVELEYVVHGTGEPVVLVHPGIFADWYDPLFEEQIRTSRCRLVTYHRVGSARSSHVAGSVSIAQHASHCHSLMRYLGIKRAHVVGHSSGGMIGLQLALDAPDAVQTLVLQESARPLTPDAPEEIEFTKTVAAPAAQRYAAGDRAGAVGTTARLAAQRRDVPAPRGNTPPSPAESPWDGGGSGVILPTSRIFHGSPSELAFASAIGGGVLAQRFSEDRLDGF